MIFVICYSDYDEHYIRYAIDGPKDKQFELEASMGKFSRAEKLYRDEKSKAWKLFLKNNYRTTAEFDSWIKANPSPSIEDFLPSEFSITPYEEIII